MPKRYSIVAGQETKYGALSIRTISASGTALWTARAVLIPPNEAPRTTRRLPLEEPRISGIGWVTAAPADLGREAPATAAPAPMPAILRKSRRLRVMTCTSAIVVHFAIAQERVIALTAVHPPRESVEIFLSIRHLGIVLLWRGLLPIIGVNVCEGYCLGQGIDAVAMLGNSTVSCQA